MSTKTEDPADLSQRLAARVRGLRRDAGLTLDQLARASGVSRSAISLIERGETAATAVVLERLATALGQTLAALFDAPPPGRSDSRRRGTAAAPAPPPSPVARLADQPLWQDPGSGYRRRNVSPAGWPQPFQIVEVHFPPGARVAFETTERAHATPQQVWVLEGRIDVTTGSGTHPLHTGDCLAMVLDAPTMFHNPSRRTARYAVVLGREPLPATRGRRR